MKKAIAACCIFASAVALADGMSFSPLNVGSVQMFAGVSEGRAVEVANQAITDAVQSNYICSVAKCAQLVEQCRNYGLTNLSSKTFTIQSGYIGSLVINDTLFTVNATLSLPLDTRLSGDCALRINVPINGSGELNVYTEGAPCTLRSVIGVDPTEIYAQESIFYFSRIGYDNGTNVILVTRQPIYKP